MNSVTISVRDNMYCLLRAYAELNNLSESSIIEKALEDFMDIVESCDPEARAAARSLSETDE